jgi:hypothetical protein
MTFMRLWWHVQEAERRVCLFERRVRDASARPWTGLSEPKRVNTCVAHFLVPLSSLAQG